MNNKLKYLIILIGAIVLGVIFFIYGVTDSYKTEAKYEEVESLHRAFKTYDTSNVYINEDNTISEKYGKNMVATISSNMPDNKGLVYEKGAIDFKPGSTDPWGSQYHLSFIVNSKGKLLGYNVKSDYIETNILLNKE